MLLKIKYKPRFNHWSFYTTKQFDAQINRQINRQLSTNKSELFYSKISEPFIGGNEIQLTHKYGIWGLHTYVCVRTAWMVTKGHETVHA